MGHAVQNIFRGSTKLDWVCVPEGSFSAYSSEIYRQPKLKSGITPCWTSQPWPHNLNEMASSKPGTAQAAPLSQPKRAAH
jgi:hypothetical protein